MTKVKLIRLWDLKKGAKIHGLKTSLNEGDSFKDRVITFDHVDGMYSYNTVTDSKGEKHVLHLRNSMWLKKVDDHYEMASDKEIEKYAPSE
jgi:hypothetical protein